MQFIPQQLQFYSSNWSPNRAMTLNIYKQQCYRHQIFGLRTKQINVYPLFYFIIFLTYLILFSNFKCDKPQKNSFIMLKIKLFSPFAQTLLEREREREHFHWKKEQEKRGGVVLLILGRILLGVFYFALGWLCFCKKEAKLLRYFLFNPWTCFLYAGWFIYNYCHLVNSQMWWEYVFGNSMMLWTVWIIYWISFDLAGMMRN